MKKCILILLLVATNIGIGCAQRYIGIKSMSVQGGYSSNEALNIEAGFEKFFGVNNSKSFSVAVNYSMRDATLDKVERDIKLNDITLNLGGRKYFNGIVDFYPYIGVDLFCGYSILKTKDISETIILSRDDSILYGARANVGCEYLFSIVSVYVNVSPQYEVKFKEFSINGNIGLKYFF
ncbi:hypothetical protein M2451_003883 [Dysgonomonas sp. PFB1-18]|uniref:hypothetical protein n=1 Tax=unclassified Dysgonomonas TaxID=2630389 RepID=UPI002475A9AC|nr:MULTISPECIES: hypothetical protein [unclassified Dysgonomonas]MDH6311073.1 hypothetical protein [Dysgonomonas sp. PF1-14]MDH6340987.1 hypothetical protein [Dysgonomonas sp. PF1-16]MDH6382542.1 hypothetical protein [Dysgonomonas sp. PFB1-18]MDH6399924.1 hypothetical protein [Dysgonomonas sp. PF1-23]